VAPAPTLWQSLTGSGPTNAPRYDRYGGDLSIKDPVADQLYNQKSGAIGYSSPNQQMIPDEQARMLTMGLWGQPLR
jgi:hypothetical protein